MRDKAHLLTMLCVVHGRHKAPGFSPGVAGSAPTLEHSHCPMAGILACESHSFAPNSPTRQRAPRGRVTPANSIQLRFLFSHQTKENLFTHFPPVDSVPGTCVPLIGSCRQTRCPLKPWSVLKPAQDNTDSRNKQSAASALRVMRLLTPKERS